MYVYIKGNHGTDWHEGMMHNINNSARNSQDMQRSVEGTKDGEITIQNAQAGARRHSQDMRRVSGDMRHVSQDARRAPFARPADVHVSQEPRARLAGMDEPNVSQNVSQNDIAFGIA